MVTAGTALTDADLTDCLKVVRESYAERLASTGDGPDKVAKGPDYVDFLLERALPTGGA